METISACISLGSGKEIDLHLPAPDAICLTNLAIAQSRLVRWAGQGDKSISVAEHAVMVADLVEAVMNTKDDDFTRLEILNVRSAALWHDGHEGLIGDMIRGLQGYYETTLPGFNAARQQLCDALDKVIFEAVGIVPLRPAEQKIIKAADHLAGEIEKSALGLHHATNAKKQKLAIPIVRFLPEDQARELFLVNHQNIQQELKEISHD